MKSSATEVVTGQRRTGFGQDADKLRVRIVLSPERRADLTGSLEQFNNITSRFT